jgi:hypothetical protein
MTLDKHEINKDLYLVTIPKPGTVNPQTDWIAKLENFGAPKTQNWRILRKKDGQKDERSGRDGRSAIDEGHYKSEDEAFDVLQKEYL